MYKRSVPSPLAFIGFSCAFSFTGFCIGGRPRVKELPLVVSVFSSSFIDFNTGLLGVLVVLLHLNTFVSKSLSLVVLDPTVAKLFTNKLLRLRYIACALRKAAGNVFTPSFLFFAVFCSRYPSHSYFGSRIRDEETLAHA